MKAESFFALMAGAAAGLVAGILIAPDKGEVTREKLKEEAGDAAHDLHVRARYARKEMNALKKTLAEQGASFKDDARAKILEQLDRLEKALSHDEAQEDVDEQAQPTA